MRSPQQVYEQDVTTGIIQRDALQELVIAHLDGLYHRLCAPQKKSFFSKPKAITGAYLCGGVGIGKTYLMDLFYDALPFEEKQRWHFHAFMEQVHKRLRGLQGIRDPLKQLAKDLAQETRVICLDELHVNDITDAMLMGGLLQALFDQRICMVCTSNQAPDMLYKGGLQRSRFLPAIDLIKQHTTLLGIESQEDYRLCHLQHAGVFFTPLDKASAQAMTACFEEIAVHHITSEPIDILGRSIPVIKRTHDIVWFDFEVLCNVPRSVSDYLVLASQFSTVMLSGVPELTESDTDKVSYFIKLVDVLYDYHTILIWSAATRLEDLYPQGRLRNAFRRCKSRLMEMQTVDYIHERSEGS